MADSTHRVEIVPVTLLRHSNADSLSVVRIEGYQAVVRTEDWKDGDLGAYVCPDSLVPVDRPEFAFLKDPSKPNQNRVRVKARRLRGEWSMGLLIPAPPGFAIGDDVAELLGVKHYDPPEPSEPGVRIGGRTESPPAGIYPVYDVEAFRKYGRHTFSPGELVHITEKIHGTNGRWLWDGEKFHCGSHKQWKKYDEECLWWRVFLQYPAMQNFLRMNPGTAIYGEVYGRVQELHYGTALEEIRVGIFDILHEGRWVDADVLRNFQPNPEGPPSSVLPWVPLFWAAWPFDFEQALEMAEGSSLVVGADHVREGIIVKPLQERWDPRAGRVNLKIVSNVYLAGKGKGKKR